MAAGFPLGSDKQRLYALELENNRLRRHLNEFVIEPLATEDLTMRDLLREQVVLLRQIRFGLSVLTGASLEEYDGD